MERTNFEKLVDYLTFFQDRSGRGRYKQQKIQKVKIFIDSPPRIIRLLEEVLTLGIEEGLIKPIQPTTSAWALIGMINAR